ncbi:MAG: NUDIX domain-containing protein [Patescibacteria group bacterium]|nr:NUDIX domain-containing protein [Patescibacteria group bacterium]
MLDLQKYRAKICLTAGGMLILENRVLLIKHHRLQRWLCPGGHIETNELPHIAAQREFWEETGVEVVAKNVGKMIDSKHSEYLPAPIFFNLHWMYRENYHARLKNQPVVKGSKGCEQHLGLTYLVRPLSGAKKIRDMKLKPQLHEVDDIGWFSLDQVKNMTDIWSDIYQEFVLGLKLINGDEN